MFFLGKTIIVYRHIPLLCPFKIEQCVLLEKGISTKAKYEKQASLISWPVFAIGKESRITRKFFYFLLGR